MPFRSVFIAIVIGAALIVAAFLLNSRRPRGVGAPSSVASVRASGKCAECHSGRQYSIVHEYELSVHAKKNVNCLACHEPAKNQKGQEHHGFVIVSHVTSANCRSCHESIYQEFLRSRHAAASWAAVYGDHDFTPEQVAFGEEHQPGAVHRPPHPLVVSEGQISSGAGCAKCHAVGRPNADGTIGNCTSCHTRHTASVEIARQPTTCGQCHMGPDHSQLEIYMESKHGVLFQAQAAQLRMDVDSGELTTRDMFVPTCATCHMSGINGGESTHDPSDRLSYYLASEISARRPRYDEARQNMKAICLNCHTSSVVERVFVEAEKAVASTNEKVRASKAVVDGLRHDGILTGKPFTRPIDFLYFDLWHYYGRTIKHGAFMGGADFVQWHGNYPLLKNSVELRDMAEQMRKAHRRGR